MKKTFFFYLILFFSFHLFSQKNTYEDWVSYTNPNEWIEKRIDNAIKGIKEIIQIPFIVRSTGWGCMCPDYYMGSTPYTQDGPWIQPQNTILLPKTSVDGSVLIVKGYFTGKIIEIDLRNKNVEPEEWLYKVPEFIILKFEFYHKENITKPKIIKTKKPKI